MEVGMRLSDVIECTLLLVLLLTVLFVAKLIVMEAITDVWKVIK
jgi:hypothetical protein